jgi:hypothetical protein
LQIKGEKLKFVPPTGNRLNIQEIPDDIVVGFSLELQKPYITLALVGGYFEAERCASWYLKNT